MEAVPTVTFTRGLCVNGRAVDAQAAEIDVLDPYEVASEASRAFGETEKVDLVGFTMGALSWLFKALCEKFTYAWLRGKLHKAPLLQEALQGIGKKKPSGREPRSPNSAVALKIRGKVLLFKNDSRNVYLCVRAEEEGLDELSWFLRELHKDLRAMQQQATDRDSGGADSDDGSEGRASGHDELQALLDQALETLRAHPQCTSAVYVKSSTRFKVLRKGDPKPLWCTVKALKRKRCEALARGADTGEVLKRQVDRAVCDAISFLDEHARKLSVASAEVAAAPLAQEGPVGRAQDVEDADGSFGPVALDDASS